MSASDRQRSKADSPPIRLSANHPADQGQCNRTGVMSHPAVFDWTCVTDGGGAGSCGKHSQLSTQLRHWAMQSLCPGWVETGLAALVRAGRIADISVYRMMLLRLGRIRGRRAIDFISLPPAHFADCQRFRHPGDTCSCAAGRSQSNTLGPYDMIVSAKEYRDSVAH
jgi:hypothetical protein